MVFERLAPPVRWLDAGCGWRLLGKDLEALEDRLVNRARMVVGVDLDFAHLKKHLNVLQRTCAPLHALPFRDSSFDLITCNMVVEHLADPAPVFRELARVLAPGGRMMVHTPNTHNYLVFANLIAKKALPRALILKLIKDGRALDDIYPTFYRANSRKTLRKLGELAEIKPEFILGLSQPQPYMRFFAPLALFELLLMRATLTRPFNRFAATIVMSFQKPLASLANSPYALPVAGRLGAKL